MEYTTLVYDKKDAIAHIQLSRPEKLNALGHTSWEELAAAVAAANLDDGVCAILLSGAGKSFCAGFDMDDSVDMKDDTLWKQWKAIRRERACVKSIWDSDKPIVAAVQGNCLGSGFELALLADIIIAAEGAKFGETEIWFSMTPQPTLLYRAGIAKAREMLLLGEKIPAEQALQYGIINKVVAAEELEQEAAHMAKRLAALPTETMQITKRMINKAIDALGAADYTDWSYDLMHVTKGMPTEVGQEFERRSREDGMREAMHWLKDRYS